MAFLDSFSNYNKIPFHGVILPKVEIDSILKTEIGAPKNCSNFEFLRYRSLYGYKKKISSGKIDKKLSKIYGERAKIELDLFEKLGFTDYILILFDVVNWCKKNKIPVGPGRGSAGASLLLYLCDVTEIDPIKFDFMLERFLSEDRAAKTIVDGVTYLDGNMLPDVDIDYSKFKRNLVLEYLQNKYPNKTSKILNLSTLQGKVLIKEVGKALAEKTESEMNIVSDHIPVEFGVVKDIEIVYGGEKHDDGTWKSEPITQFKNWCDENREVYETALLLRGIYKNKSVHASGILVSYDDIENIVPVELTPDKETVCSYDMYSAQEILIKLDCLGLRNLDIIQNTCDQVGIKNYFDIDINDKSIYDYLSNPEAPYMGIFQAEEGLGEKTLRKIAPKNIHQIVASVSLGRPGGMDSIDKYVNYIHNNVLEKIHPKVDEVLKNDANLIIFQESLMKLANRVYGLSMKDANKLRKVIGKKQRDKVDEWEKILYDAGEKQNIPPNVTKIVWNTVKKSADYLFPMIHGVEYSHITALTAYLKANYTKEFFLSLLKFPPESGKNKKENSFAKIQKELKYFGIQLLPPCLLKGNFDFVIENENIRFGINSIKGLAEAALQKLNNFKPENCNKFQMFQAARQAGLPCGVMAALIMSGALDVFVSQGAAGSRSKLSFECLLFSKLKDREKLFCIQNGEKFNFDLIEMVKNILDWCDSVGKKVARSTRLNTLRKETVKYQEIYKNNSQNEPLANLSYEKNLLGFNYSATLKEIFSKGSNEIINLAEFKNLDPNNSATVVCHLDEFKISVSKKGNPVMKLFVSDETEVNYFYFAGRAYQDFLTECNERPDLNENDIVAIKLMKSKDGQMGFVQRLVRQDCKIFTKLSDIKENSDSNDESPDILPAAVEKPEKIQQFSLNLNG